MEAAARFRYDAVLVRPPFYYAAQMSTPALLHYFRSVADRSPLPVLLYNVPKNVPCQIPVELVADLAAHPNIIGIKDSSGSVERIRSLVAATRSAPRRAVAVTSASAAVTNRMLEPVPAPSAALLPGGGVPVAASSVPIETRTAEVGFQVLCGSGSVVLDALEAGATGAILAFASFAPRACLEIYLAWKNHNRKLAEEAQRRIAAPNRRIVGEIGIGGVKFACDRNGFYGGPARAPLLPVTAQEKAEIESLLAAIRT
jgi:dihydrodipicolinate synthase/N-acetylneuraminate lyase